MAWRFPVGRQAADNRGAVGPQGLIHNLLERRTRDGYREIEQFGHVGIRFPTADPRTIGSGVRFHQAQNINTVWR